MYVHNSYAFSFHCAAKSSFALVYYIRLWSDLQRLGRGMCSFAHICSFVCFIYKQNSVYECCAQLHNQQNDEINKGELSLINIADLPLSSVLKIFAVPLSVGRLPWMLRRCFTAPSSTSTLYHSLALLYHNNNKQKASQSITVTWRWYEFTVSAVPSANSKH